MPDLYHLNEKKLLIISLSIVSFFISIYLINHFKIDYILIGVLRELLTIPVLLAQMVFLVISVLFLFKRKESKLKYMTIISTILLITSTFLTVGSFFI